MSTKRISLLVLAAALVIEVIFLVWIRGDYRSTMDEGVEYKVPAQIEFKGDFYHKNYLSLAIPLTEASWEGHGIPEKGEEIYLLVGKNKEGMMEITGATDQKPGRDYIITRVSSYVDGKVYYPFPADRMYMSKEQLEKLSVVELSERIQVKNEESKKTETHMKNEVTALLHIKDGRVTIAKVLANGSPIEQTYTTVGKNMNIKYANSGKERDQYSTRINAEKKSGE